MDSFLMKVALTRVFIVLIMVTFFFISWMITYRLLHKANPVPTNYTITIVKDCTNG